MPSLWPVCIGHKAARSLGWLGVVLLALCAACAVPPDRTPEPPSDPASLYAYHGEPGAWFTPWRRRDVSTTDMLRWAVSRNAYTGEWRDPPEVPRVENDGSSLAVPQKTAALTWVGHSTFAIHDRADVFLTDPHFGQRALLPKRHHPPGIPISAVPADAFALISHNHYDHLDAYTVDTLPPSIRWFVPMGLAEWFRDRGPAECDRAGLVADGRARALDNQLRALPALVTAYRSGRERDPVVRLGRCLGRTPLLFCRRHGLFSRLRRNRPALRSDRCGAAADWRL